MSSFNEKIAEFSFIRHIDNHFGPRVYGFQGFIHTKKYTKDGDIEWTKHESVVFKNRQDALDFVIRKEKQDKKKGG